MGANLILRPPRPADEHMALKAHAESLTENIDTFFLHTDGRPFGELVDLWEQYSRGVNIPEGKVAADFLFAEVEGQVVGRTSIRHELNDFLFNYGGHIGYYVLPRFRRRGYATEILAQSCARLKELGVDRALITCADTNLGSATVIERCGGVLENTVTSPEGDLRRRYWIDL